MNTRSGIRPLLLILVCFSTVLRLGAAGVAGGELPPAVTGALVKVEVLVQAAEGEEPKAAGWNKRCPKCGSFHDNALDDALRDERPALSAGFLVAPDRVLTADPMIQSRFVQRWQVRVGDEIIGATPVAWALDRSALLLALERPAVAAKPLVFSPQAKEPFYTIHHGDEGNGWSTWIQPFQGGGWLLQDGQRHRAVAAGSLFVDASGAPVAVSMSERPTPHGRGSSRRLTRRCWRKSVRPQTRGFCGRSWCCDRCRFAPAKTKTVGTVTRMRRSWRNRRRPW
jgi:hypothetical protein